MRTGSMTLGVSESTLNKLRELRRLCVDSSKGFEECAELSERPGLKTLFREFAEERRELDAELEQQIAMADKAEDEEGSYLAAWHRAWIKLHNSITTMDEHMILSDAEMGEDAIKQAYESALTETVGSPIHPLLLSQYQLVRAAHDRVRELRDATKR